VALLVLVELLLGKGLLAQDGVNWSCASWRLLYATTVFQTVSMADWRYVSSLIERFAFWMRTFTRLRRVRSP